MGLFCRTFFGKSETINNKMKSIVIFHPALAPYRIDFFNSLHDAFDVSFYFEHQMPAEQSFNMENLNKRIRFSYSILPSGLFGIKNLRLSVFKVLRRENPVVVFISEYTILGLLVLLYKFCFNRNLKIVITCDDNLQMAQSVNLMKRSVRSLLLCHVELVLLVNDEVKNWYEKCLPFKAKYFYFPIVQSDEVFRKELEKVIPLSNQLRQLYHLENKKVILYVGRLVKVKNVELLLEAFKELFKTNKNVELIVVGDGEEARILQQQIKDLVQESYVIFTGKKDGYELMAYYNLGDIFVLPSKYEPFGAVVNEALLAGCYVLCSLAAGASCLIEDGVNGNVFSPDSLQELVSLLKRSLDNVKEDKHNRMLLSYDAIVNSLVGEIECLN